MNTYRYLVGFILFSFFTTLLNAQSDCYLTFYHKGKEEFEKLNFDEALKQFKAAKFCLDKPVVNDSLDIWIAKTKDGYIEELKKQRNKVLEALRMTEIMRDSAHRADAEKLQAIQSKELLIHLNDYEGLADYKVKEDNLEEALTFYKKAFSILKSVNKQDSILIRKEQLLKLKVAEVNTFQNYLQKGDSLFIAGNLPRAYYYLLEARNFSFGKKKLDGKIKTIEDYISKNPSVINALPFKEFREIMSFSAEANSYLGNKSMSDKRIFQFMRYQPFQYSFIRDSEIKDRAKEYDKRILKAMKFNLTFQGDFGSQSKSVPFTIRRNGASLNYDGSVSPKWDFFTLGLSLDLGKRVETGFDFSFSSHYQDVIGLEVNLEEMHFSLINNKGIGSSGEIKWTNLRFYGAYTLFNSNFRRGEIKRTSFLLQAVLGLELVKFEPRVWVGLFKPSIEFDPPHGRVSPSFPPSVNGLKVSSQLWSDYSNLIIGTRDLYNLSTYDQDNINLMAGFKVFWKPLELVPEIGISLEFLRKQTLNYSKSIETNPINLMNLFSNGFENSGSSSQITEYLIDHFNQYWNDDIEIEISRRQFLYAWSLRAGVTYDF